MVTLGFNGDLKSNCNELGIIPPPINANEEQKFEWLARVIILAMCQIKEVQEHGCSFGAKVVHNRTIIKDFFTGGFGGLIKVLSTVVLALAGSYYALQILEFFNGSISLGG